MSNEGSPYAHRPGWRTQLWTVVAATPDLIPRAGEQVNGMLTAIAEQGDEAVEVRFERAPGRDNAVFVLTDRVPTRQ